ncbi:MAG: protein translocase subunit SecF [Micrococcales bacterium]|nr:protein translocase subunit SecF [Micrococcales bacterium]
MPKRNFAGWGNSLYTGKRSYNIVGLRRRFIGIGVLFVVVFGFLIFKPGLTLGIEFRGGSVFRVITTESSIDLGIAEHSIKEIAPQEAPRITKVGQGSLRAETMHLDNVQTEKIREALARDYGLDLNDVTSTFIGPVWGADVFAKAMRGAVIFLVLVMIAMSLYFRAWRMAISAGIALIHDLVVTVGVYALVGFEVTPATIVGFLTILGYSLYDTVVIFDKVRENTQGVLDQTQYTYAEAANLALNQTLVRSINTSVVAILPVASILFIGAFLMGAGTLRDLSLALFVGMATGIYSSVFVATPWEVALRSRERKINQHTTKVEQRRAAAGDSGEKTQVSRLTPIGAIRPGAHQGRAAQPKRRPAKR